MDKVHKEQLEAMLTACRELGADVQYHPEYGHFTAMIWEDFAPTNNEEYAKSVQKQIQQRSTQYPCLVCYCFDTFSTLVYAI